MGTLVSTDSDLLDQEFEWTTGHLAAVLGECSFAPSLLTFWFVNGALDSSTAVVIGAVASPGRLAVRLMACVLLVPVFLLLRAGYYLVHPVHRRMALSRACPGSEVLSLDWFSAGILATGLPLALRDLEPWVAMNWLRTRDELRELPMVRHTLPRHDPPRLVATSAALGTLFYTGVVAAATGHVALFP